MTNEATNVPVMALIAQVSDLMCVLGNLYRCEWRSTDNQHNSLSSWETTVVNILLVNLSATSNTSLKVGVLIEHMNLTAIGEVTSAK